jgi:hypothetical protein
LELCEIRGDLTIPAIPTLGNLKISHSVISTLSIQGSSENYPIYCVEIMYCKEVKEIIVERPISFMKLCFRRVSEVAIHGEENIKYTVFKDLL